MAVLTAPAPHADRDPTAITRRQLIAWGATAGAAATLHGLVAAPPSVGQDTWLRRASYTGRIGQSFHAALGLAKTVSLQLLTVHDLTGTTPSGAPLAGRDDAFLLEFRGPSTPRLGQGVFELHHHTLGRNRLFLVPQAPGPDGNTYAVVVHRANRRAGELKAATSRSPSRSRPVASDGPTDSRLLVGPEQAAARQARAVGG